MKQIKFSAIKGFQAGKEFYTAMVPLGELEELFELYSSDISPDKRAQRKLNEKRIPEIKRYILENRDSYVFSALAASIDGKYSFTPVNELFPSAGELTIEAGAKLLINDGQHRKAAIVEAIKKDPTLKSETIPVVLFKDRGLRRSQQMFTDLNKHAVKTSNSISELYDSKDIVSEITRVVLSENTFLGKYTDKERDNLSKYSAALFTFNTFYKANERLLSGNRMDDGGKSFATCFWDNVVKSISLWNDLEEGTLAKTHLREDYLICQSVVIEAIGRLGNALLDYSGELSDIVSRLSQVDWGREAKIWRKRCINEKGKMVKSDLAVCLTCNAIKKQIGFELSSNDLEKERKLRK